MPEREWIEVGQVADLQRRTVTQITQGKTKIALVYKNSEFSAISGVCNHVGGPLGEGKLEGDYIVCPWHYWKFHCKTGQGEPGFEEDQVPAYAVKVENDRVYVDLTSATKRKKKPHEPHPLARPPVRQDGPIRVVGISTTVVNQQYPRYSTSETLLEVALDHARSHLEVETRCLKLSELSFRPCEGYYSKSAHACTWPCSITQMDPNDQLDRVYEAFVHWGDVILVATPIRWGSASSLYYKMVERMNCIQNQETIAGRHLLKNKVAAFIITGGQDNVQGVAGQLLGFFAEVGCQFPQYPFIAHSRGWSAEDMERNVQYVQRSKELREGAQSLVTRAVDMAKLMVEGRVPDRKVARGGRKAHQLDVKAQM